jgi:pimeloyl-ACP methyl ester carboxylesterase
LFRAAAVAFALAGFSRAATIGVASHTEQSILETGGLAPLGRTADGATLAGLVLVALAVVLAWRWLRSLEPLARRPVRGPLGLPSPTHLMRGLLDGENRPFARVGRLSALVALVAGSCELAAVVAGRPPGEPLSPLALELHTVVGVLAVVACGLGVWLIDRLAEVAIDRESPFARPISVRRRGLRAVPIVALVALVFSGPIAVSVATVHTPVDCPGLPGGDCRVVTVPLDQAHPERGGTLQIVYRVVPARGRQTGTLFVLTGGPGIRGLSEADPRIAELDPAVLDHFDVVFFDQRGVGGSGGLDCTDAVRAEQAQVEEAGLGPALDFVRACLAELGPNAARLPYLSTAQAAEDIDAIRAVLGAERIVVYGESYGTRLAQAYVARHPDRVAGLILDGAIDPALGPLDFWSKSAAGFNSSLAATLDECDRTPSCSDDVAGGDAATAFEKEVAQLERAPVHLDYPGDFGPIATSMGSRDLVSAVTQALYRPDSRMELQRAIAAASHGDWLLMYRLVVVAQPQPVIGLAHLSPWTPTSYYAIECADIDAPALGGLDAFERAADAAAGSAGLFAGLVLQDAPCLDWPAPTRDMPEPIGSVGALPRGVPSLVFAATADPITPIVNAQGIVARSPGTPLVTVDGGRHVSLWSGDDCVDAAAHAFLLEGRTPAPGTRCPGSVATPYLPRFPSAATAFADDETAIAAVTRELEVMPEVTDWDGLGQIVIGCPAGGDVHFYGFPGEIGVLVSRCAFVPGLVLDGQGSMDPSTRTITLAVERTH